MKRKTPPPTALDRNLPRVLLLLGIALATALLYTGVWYKRSHDDRQRFHATFANARVLDIAFMDFALDHANRFPRAERWEEEVKPYLKGQSIENLMTVSVTPGQPPKRFAMNRAMSNRDMMTLSNGHDPILLYVSSNITKNAHGDPPAKFQEPPGNIVVLADGFVDALSRPLISEQ